MKKLQAFSWGYWGWGTHTKEFVKTVDAIERQRGYRRRYSSTSGFHEASERLDSGSRPSRRPLVKIVMSG